MTIRRTGLLALNALALAALSFAAPAHAEGATGRGHVYTMSNAASGNALLVYSRSAGGLLSLAQTIPTQGNGTSAGLGSQGAVTLSQDGQYLFVVNAGSATVSTFHVGSDGATLLSTVASGGTTPTSVTESRGLVYVLNAGGDGNVSGFRNVGGTLVALADGTRGLSAVGGTAPAEVSFDKLGRTLVVSERATSLLTSYAVRPDGTLAQQTATASSGTTPFGFSFDAANHMIVSEAFAGAPLGSALSSYRFAANDPHTPKLVTGSAFTQQTAACWTAVTPDGRFVFTTNAGSGSVSAYRIAHTGALTLTQSVAEVTAGSHPIDVATSPSGRRLYVINGNATIGTFQIGGQGHLTALSTTTVPAGVAGIAVD